MHALRLFCFAACLVLPSAAAPAAFSFLRIAHTTQAIPGGTGNFTGFDPQASRLSPSVAFRGFGAGGQEGIYTGNGTQMTRLADRATTVPGTAGTFDSFGSPAAGESVVVQASGAGRTGIYRITTGGAVQVVDDAPTGAATFGRAAASVGDLVAYRRDSTIMSNRTGALAPVNFSVPNVNIQSLGDPDLASHAGLGGTPLGVRVNYLQGGVSHTGVLIKSDGAGDEILFPSSELETREASVNWSGAIAVNQGDTAVRFRPFLPFPMSDQQVIVGDPIPGGTGAFVGFRGVAAGSPTLGFPSSDVVFVGLGSGGQEGIYVNGFVGQGFGVTKVIARGDALDGRTVASLALGRDSELGSGLAFHATFTDGSSGIYFTQLIPEPAAGILAIGVTILCGERPKRRRARGGLRRGACAGSMANAPLVKSLA